MLTAPGPVLQLCWFSIVTGNGIDKVAVLRILRLVRVLKEFESIPQLQMIINGLVNGMYSAAFIAVLFCMLLYSYALFGTYAFAANDPHNFGELHNCFLTLLRAATEGNWPQLMYRAMYGCDMYYEKMDGPCESSMAEPQFFIGAVR